MTLSTKQTIPLLDLQAQYYPMKDKILEKMTQVFNSKGFINGPEVDALEEKIAPYCDSRYAIGVSSGSDALIVAMMALEIGPGDEVITTPFSFFSTAGSIARVGATPVFCDIDPDTFNIDVSQIAAKITPKTRAIMPVHLFGQCADMDPITSLASQHNLAVIEDAAQAIGATYKGKKAGSFGTVGCFSFFPSKNLGACGDAGIVTTNDEALYTKIKSLRMHGETQRYHHKYIGGNFRIDALQAAILSIKLDYLDDQHAGRRKNAAFYQQHLTKTGIQKPVIHPECQSIYNQYTLRVNHRDAFKAHLQSHTVGHNVYYPIPLHLQECFAYLGYKKGDFPHSEQAALSVISLPIYSELQQDQLLYICDTIHAYEPPA